MGKIWIKCPKSKKGKSENVDDKERGGGYSGYKKEGENWVRRGKGGSWKNWFTVRKKLIRKTKRK